VTVHVMPGGMPTSRAALPGPGRLDEASAGRVPGQALAEGEGGGDAPLAWRGVRSARAGTGHQGDLRGGRIDGKAWTDRLGGGAQGLLPAGMADGQVRDHLGVLPAVRRAGRKRGEGRAGQGAERRRIARAEPDGLLAEPADPVQRELERAGPGEQLGQQREQRLTDPGGRQERVQHGDMRGDSVPGGLVEPGTVAADGWLGGGHGHQQRGLPAGTGTRDQTWHAGEATLSVRRAFMNASMSGGIVLVFVAENAQVSARSRPRIAGARSRKNAGHERPSPGTSHGRAPRGNRIPAHPVRRVWLAAAQVLKFRFATARTIVAGVALAAAGLLLIIATHWGHFA